MGFFPTFIHVLICSVFLSEMLGLGYSWEVAKAQSTFFHTIQKSCSWIQRSSCCSNIAFLASRASRIAFYNTSDHLTFSWSSAEKCKTGTSLVPIGVISKIHRRQGQTPTAPHPNFPTWKYTFLGSIVTWCWRWQSWMALSLCCPVSRATPLLYPHLFIHVLFNVRTGSLVLG